MLFHRLGATKMVQVVQPRRPRFRIFVCLALIGLAAGGFAYWRYSTTNSAESTRRPQPAVPATVASVVTQDVPIYLMGLGIVQASNTTTLHTQVDGKLQTVNFTEGRMVRRGDVLAQIDPRLYQAALDQAKAKKAQDEAQLISASKDLERIQSLVASAAGTQQNLDRQIAVVAQVKATIQADQAAIESAQTQVDYTTIRAPTDGRMGIRQIDPGNILRANDATGTIAVLTQTKPIAVIFTLPEKNLEDVRRAMARGPVEIIAYDQDDTKALATGTLMLIDNQIDQTTGTIKLKATFPNDDERLWSGEFVHVRLLNETRKNALVVPSQAIQRGPKGLFVWRVQPDGTAQPQPVEAPASQGGITVVANGVAAGDRVVTDGQYRLQAGMRVEAKPFAAQASGDAS
jgi:multidrug efflux system membrane fusion protein